MQYAKIINNALVYPSSSEFNGIPGWTGHDMMLRSKGYMPVHNYPASQLGKIIVLDSFEVMASVSTHMEPRQVVIDGHQEMQETPITVDESYIEITGWHYVDETPAEQPAPQVVYYDKYEIKRACERRNLWTQVKTLIESAGKWDSFLLIQNLSSDNQELMDVMPDIIEIFGQSLVEEVLGEAAMD